MKTRIFFTCCALSASLMTARAQVANDDFYITPAGTTLSVTAPGVLANDTGGNITAVLVSGPANGTLTLNTGGSFTYTPTNNFTGMDGFTYRAVKNSQTSSPASVDLMVLAPGEVFYDNFSRPITSGSIVPWTMINDGRMVTSTWGITNNWMIGNGPAFSYGYAYYNNSAWKDYSVQAQMRFSVNFAASAGVLGRLNPTTGAHYAAWVYPEQSNEFNIQPINGIPRLQLIKYENWTNYTLFGQRVSLPSVQTNWHTVKLAFQGSNVLAYFDGNLVINLVDNGTIDGLPAYTNGGVGLNMWTSTAPPAYRLSVSNFVVTTTAVANNDSYLATNNLVLRIPSPGILTNDVGAGTLTAILAASPTNGTLTLTNNGGFAYAPTNNSATSDSFTYRCTDGQSTSGVAVVTFTLARSASASNDAYTTSANLPLSVSQPGVLANDQSSIGPLTALLSSGPSNGTLVLTNNGGFRYTPSSNFTGPDSFAYRCTDGQTTSGVATVTLTVLPLPVLTVTADNKARLYGATNPVWTASYSGFTNGDTTNVLTGSPAFNSSADTASPIGSYPITIGAGTLSATNYSFQFVNGTLTVTPAALAITARSTNKIYGQSLTFAGTEFTSAGLVNSDTITLVSLTSVGATAAAGVAGSPYPVNVNNATGVGLSNYVISYFPGILTINPASLTVTADDKTRMFSLANPVLTVTYNGFVNLENTNDLAGNPALSTAADSSSPAGTYPIVATRGTLSDTNYSCTFDDGTLTVTSAPAPVIISYGLTNQIFSVEWNSVTGATYELQYAADLTASNWTKVLPDVEATDSISRQTNLAGAAPQQFYRVKLINQ